MTRTVDEPAAASTAAPTHVTGPRLGRWFLAIGIPFGLLLAVLVPPVMVSDSPSHLVRIDQISRGHLVAPLTHGSALVNVDPCLEGRVTAMSLWAFTKPVIGRQFHGTPCQRLVPFDDSNMALNSPVAYLPAVAGYGIGRALGGLVAGVWLARLAGLGFYLAVCWAAIRIAPWGKPFLFVVALLPTSMTLAASLSADPVPLAAGLLAVALLLRLREPGGHDWRLLATFTASLLVLAFSKNLYAVGALTVLLVPAQRFRSTRARAAWCTAVLATVVVGVGAWTVAVVNRVNLRFEPWKLPTSDAQRAWIRAHPLGFAHIAVRSLATTVIPRHTLPGLAAVPVVHGHPSVAPWPIVLLALVVAGCAVWAGGPAARAADRAAVLTICGVVLVVVTGLVLYGEAISVTPRLWQVPLITYIEGRFYLPVLALLVLLPWSLRASLARHAPDWRVVPAGVAVLAMWQAVQLAMLY